MQLHFDKQTIPITLNDSLLVKSVLEMYKHLQHLPLNFRLQDSPYYLDQPHVQLVEQLVYYGNQLGITVDQNLCLAYDQQYFNTLHEIYEKNYDGNPVWLDFHEHIHICELSDHNFRAFVIDYREKSGLLKKKFDMNWMSNTTTRVKAGDVYIRWSELGKTPYGYWKNFEPEDFTRLCELAKPWLLLKPKLSIALEDFDFLEGRELDQFDLWWSEYQSKWCAHWNISHWGIQEMFSVGIIGHIDQIDDVKLNLQNQIFPTKTSI